MYYSEQQPKLFKKPMLQKAIVRCSVLENRIDWLNRIMRDQYPEDQTRIMRLIIKTRKKLLIIERLLNRVHCT
jgi:hypothetical protein